MATTKKNLPATQAKPKSRPKQTKKPIRKHHSLAKKSNVKDMLIDTALGVLGAVAVSMISKFIIKSDGTPAGETAAAKKRVYTQLGIAAAGVMFGGKGGKFVSKASSGAAVYSAINAIKVLAPQQNFLGEEILIGYDYDQNQNISADELSDEFGEEISMSDEFGEEAYGDDLL